VLTAHLKKIHNESPFPCDHPGCPKVGGKGYVRERDLIKHKKNCYDLEVGEATADAMGVGDFGPADGVASPEIDKGFMKLDFGIRDAMVAPEAENYAIDFNSFDMAIELAAPSTAADAMAFGDYDMDTGFAQNIWASSFDIASEVAAPSTVAGPMAFDYDMDTGATRMF